jgi:5'-deoxynucleotidase YfbR-like HD superfamily hydrolase
MFPIAGKEILGLWLEYEDCTTPEAAVVKDFDK